MININFNKENCDNTYIIVAESGTVNNNKPASKQMGMCLKIVSWLIKLAILAYFGIWL